MAARILFVDEGNIVEVVSGEDSDEDQDTSDSVSSGEEDDRSEQESDSEEESDEESEDDSTCPVKVWLHSWSITERAASRQSFILWLLSSPFPR